MIGGLRNYDLFRASLAELPPDAIERAFAWLSGSGPFPSPTSIHFDLTLRCTARCVHCDQWSWPAQPELGRAELERLIAIFASRGVSALTLAGGNPTLHPDFTFVLGAAGRSGIKTGVVTEVFRDAGDIVVEAICRHASWIRFSLDGPTSLVHDEIRRVPGLFVSVVDNIQTLRKANPLLPIGLNCVIQRKNVRHLDGMLQLAEDLGVGAVLFKLAHGPGRDGRVALSASDYRPLAEWIDEVADTRHGIMTNLRELRTLLRHVFRVEGVQVGRPAGPFYVEHRVRCFVPLFFLVCDSRADAYPCDYLQANTRTWSAFKALRQEYCLGNFLSDPDLLMRRLEETVFPRIHGLPSEGNPECGCCTRFCQLNAALTAMRDGLDVRPALGRELAEIDDNGAFL